MESETPVDVVTFAEYKQLERLVLQLQAAIAGLTERLDGFDNRRLGPRPDATEHARMSALVESAGEDVKRMQADEAQTDALRLTLVEDPQPGVPPSRTWGDVTPPDPPLSGARAADARLAAERPFRRSPHARDVILTAGGRQILCAYNSDEVDALVALLNA